MSSDLGPDLGPPRDITSPLEDGLRATAERTFIQMVRAAFVGHETFPYSDNPEERRLYVQSALSNEDQAFFPRVEIRVGPVSEFEGSLNNLNKWTKAVRRHLYADQAQVAFICSAEESAEANALADRVRRLIDLARKDLGRRGIFGMMKPKMQPPQPARKGTEQDDVYQAVVQSGFVIIERQERLQDESNPEYGGPAGPSFDAGDPTRCEEEASGPSPAAPVSFVASATDSTTTRAVLTFSTDLCTYQVDGITAQVGQTSVKPDVVRDNRSFDSLIMELPGAAPADPIIAEYAPGNLKDAKNRPVQAFGPIEAEWQQSSVQGTSLR